MYSNTRLGEVMKGLSRGAFEKVVSEYDGDKHSKGFRCWDQFMAMTYAQVSGCRSLREVEAGFNAQTVHHYHLGTREIKRSTLAEANTKRNSGLYEAVCRQLMQQVHGHTRKELKTLLYLMDSTPISLKGLGYDEWTRDNHSHRTQGLKVHMILAADRAAPVYMDISAPNVNDIEVGRQIELERGATYVFDKGYYDYNWWYQIHRKQALFVTRLKKNAGIQHVESHDVAGETIIEDATITFTYKHPGGGRTNDYHGTPLRKIVVHRPDKKTPLIVVTNDFERSAEEIAALYKRRWEIELFFKWLKQNLKIKQFLGRSENAVKIQIYIAIITYLLVWRYRRDQGVTESLKLCLVTLRSTLFQRPDVEQTAARKRRLRRLKYQRHQMALVLA